MIFKKIAAGTVCIVMLITGSVFLPNNKHLNTTIPVSAEEYSGLYYTIANGSVTITNCDKTAESIEIPETINGVPVETIGYKAFYNCTNLKYVNLPSTIKKIDNYAFYGCESLSDIYLNDGLTEIGNYAFYGCINIFEIYFPSTLTSVGNYAFYGCTALFVICTSGNLTSIGISAFDKTAYYSAYTPDMMMYIGNVAYTYKGTMPENTSIILKDNTTGIAAGCFSKCSGLISVTIPKSVNVIGESAFLNCSSLSDISIANSVVSVGQKAFDGTLWYESQNTGVVYIGNIAYAYKGDKESQTKIVIKNGTTDIADYAFSNFTELTRIVFPDTVKKIGKYAFLNCISISRLNLPDSLIEVDENAFEGCTNISELQLGSQLESLANIPYNYSCLESINVSSNNKIYSSENGVLYNRYKTKLIKYPPLKIAKEFIVPDTVSLIESYAFNECIKLNYITLSNKTYTINDYAFRNCENLKWIVIPQSTNKIYASALTGCANLTTIYGCYYSAAEVYAEKYGINFKPQYDISTSGFRKCYLSEETSFDQNNIIVKNNITGNLTAFTFNTTPAEAYKKKLFEVNILVNGCKVGFVPIQTGLLYDSNLDGNINIYDASVIASVLANGGKFSSDMSKLCADANKDGKVNIYDAAFIAVNLSKK